MSEAAPDAPDDFHSRTIDRIRRTIIVLGIGGLIPAWIVWGWPTGVGFGLGAAVAYLNFWLLEKGVAGVIQLTIQTGTPVSGRRIVQRFLLRYFLMAVVAFVILAVIRDSLYGLFAGLLLPVTAILCEAVYEAYKVISG